MAPCFPHFEQVSRSSRKMAPQAPHWLPSRYGSLPAGFFRKGTTGRSAASAMVGGSFRGGSAQRLSAAGADGRRAAPQHASARAALSNRSPESGLYDFGARCGQLLFEVRVVGLEGQRGLEIARGGAEVAPLEIGHRHLVEALSLAGAPAALAGVALLGLVARLRELDADAAVLGEAHVVGAPPARVAQHGVGLRDAHGDLADGL